MPPPFEHVTRLVDTNVASYLAPPDSSDQALADLYRPHLANQQLAIAFQTWAELRLGAELRGWSSSEVDDLLEPYEIIPWSEELVDIYVELRARAYIRNRRFRTPRLSAADGWIAATAYRLEVPLVTHDRALSSIPEIEAITALPDAQ